MALESLRRRVAGVRQSRLVRRVVPLWGAEGAALLTGLVQAIIVARVLGPHNYGVVALAIAIPRLIFSFFDPQASEAVVRYVSRFMGENDPQRAAAVPRLAYFADCVLAIVGMAVMAALAPFAAHQVIGSPGSAHLLILSAVGLCASAPTSTSRALLITLDRYTLVGKIASFSTTLRTVLVLGLLALGMRAEAVVLGLMTGYLVETILMGVAADRALLRDIGLSWRSVETRQLGSDRTGMLSFMVYTELTSLVAVLVKQADIVILGAARGARSAGYYRLAWSLVAPVTSLTVPLQQVFYPRAVGLAAAGDWRGLRAAIGEQTRRVGAPLAGMVLASIPVVMWSVPRIAGRDYRAAVGPAGILLLGAAVGVFLFWMRPGFLASGLVRPLLVVSTLAAALSLVGFAVAAPLAGPAGVAAVRTLLTGVVGGGAGAIYLLGRLRNGDGVATSSASPLAEDPAV